MKILIGISLGAVDDKKKMKHNPLRDNIPQASKPRAAPKKGKLGRVAQSNRLRHEMPKSSSKSDCHLIDFMYS